MKLIDAYEGGVTPASVPTTKFRCE